MSAPRKTTTAKGQGQPAGTPMPSLKKAIPGAVANCKISSHPKSLLVVNSVSGFASLGR